MKMIRVVLNAEQGIIDMSKECQHERIQLIHTLPVENTIRCNKGPDQFYINDRINGAFLFTDSCAAVFRYIDVASITISLVILKT